MVRGSSDRHPRFSDIATRTTSGGGRSTPRVGVWRTPNHGEDEPRRRVMSKVVGMAQELPATPSDTLRHPPRGKRNLHGVPGPLKVHRQSMRQRLTRRLPGTSGSAAIRAPCCGGSGRSAVSGPAGLLLGRPGSSLDSRRTCRPACGAARFGGPGIARVGRRALMFVSRDGVAARAAVNGRSATSPWL